MPKVWKVLDPDISLKNSLAAALRTSSVFAQLLINRGICDEAEARHFLDASLEELHDPFLMKGMREGVALLKAACAAKGKIFVATDFDADGVTSCSILETALKGLGAQVEHYVPHRLKDGYGLNEEGVEKARAFGAGIFVSLDCGITAHKEVEALKALGIKTIIIDHHEPPAELPKADAILNPKQLDCGYPFRELASVGLAFKVAQALGTPDVMDFLDIVALGTIADVAPLLGENRIFVKHGLDALEKTSRPGLRSLIEAAGISGKKMSTRSVSFMLAPRINASGRIDTAHASLDLLLTKDRANAARLATMLNETNRSRQQIEEKVMNEALEQIEDKGPLDDQHVIVLSQEDWHPGVVGIVAAKIADRYFRPTVIISVTDGVGRGSARSVPHFHIYEALMRCEDHLREFGGHKYAAGLTIEADRIDEFRRVLNAVAAESLSARAQGPVLEVDAHIPLTLINEELLTDMDKMSPFGEGNRRPLFISTDLLVRSKPQLLGKNTLKFWVSDGEKMLEAIAFGMGSRLDEVAASERIDIAYNIGWDEWDPHNPIQLEVRDLKTKK